MLFGSGAGHRGICSLSAEIPYFRKDFKARSGGYPEHRTDKSQQSFAFFVPCMAGIDLLAALGNASGYIGAGNYIQ